MGFINNHKDAFRKSNSAWGDDNITIYNLPTRNKNKSALITNNMGYNDLEDMITQVASIEPSCEEDELILNSKLESLSLEKEKRDSLENVTRIERDDAFEPRKRVIKQDVIKKVKPRVVKNIDSEELELESSLCDNNEEPIDSANTGMNSDTTTFLLAAIIVIAVVKMID